MKCGETLADISKANKMLDWRLKVDINDGLRNTLHKFS